MSDLAYPCCLWIRKNYYKFKRSLERDLQRGHNTSLHKAVKFQCNRCVNFCLGPELRRRLGENIFSKLLNAQNSDKDTALIHGLKWNSSSEVLLKLIDANCDRMASDCAGDTALHYACRMGKTDVASKLIEAGVDVNVVNCMDISPFESVVRQGDCDLAAMFVFHNATMPDYMARRYSNVDLYPDRTYDEDSCMYNVLLGCCDDLNKLLCGALSKSYLNFAKIIIDAGANINATINGSTCVHSALTASTIDCFEYVWSICDHKCVLKTNDSFLNFFLRRCNYNANQKLKALTLIFNSTCFDEILDEYFPARRTPNGTLDGLYINLFKMLSNQNDLYKRIPYLCLFLSHGIMIYQFELSYIYHNGFNVEFQGILFTGAHIARDFYVNVTYCKYIHRLVYNTLAYEEMYEGCPCELPDDVPCGDSKVSSLTRLSRDAIRKKIFKSNRHLGVAYVHLCVLRLADKLPDKIGNLLLLKEPITKIFTEK